MDIRDLMNQAQNLQEKMKHELAEMAIESSSGGGAVRVVINGHKELTNIDIQPEALADAELLADMILAALGSAYAQVESDMKQRVSSMMGGLDVSGLGDLFKP